MRKNLAEDFIPFEPVGPRGASESSPRLKVMPKPGAPEDSAVFATIQTGPKSAHAAHSPSASITPTVTLQREGDRITVVRVECACGQVIELNCSY